MDSNDITRRRVIGTLGAAGTIGLAGCGGDGGDGSDGSDGSDGGNGGDGSDGSDGSSGGDGSDGGDGGGDGDGGGQTEGRPDANVRIGMVQPRSGALGPYGTIALRGFLTYFGYAGADIPSEIGTGEYTLELGDTTYTMEVRDSSGAAGEAQTQAREMAQNADIIAGGTSSASAIAIANNVAKRANVPYMAGPAATVGLTGNSDNCGETVYRASETVAMDAQSGGKYIANERSDIESVYIYYADYSFGQSVFENYRRVLEANGVSVAGSQPLPQGYSDDWPGQFDNATDAGVDAIIGGFTVATLPAMLGTYLANDYDFRFVGGWGTRLSGGALGAALQNNLDELTADSIESAGLGPLTTRYHWNQYDNDINTEANQVHRDTYGTNADLFTSGMFTAASAIDQAVTEAGSGSGDDIRKALKGMSVSTTMKGEGGYQFQDWNNQARSAMTVADAVPTGDAEFWDAPIQPSDPVQTYGIDETTQPQEQQSCDLS